MHGSEVTAGVLSTAKVKIPSGRKRELLLTLSSLLELIRCEEGCCNYRFYLDSNEDDTYVLVGEWQSSHDWERHLHSENFAVLQGTLGVLGKGEKHDFNVSTLIR